ncbi:MAG: endo-1,4-beta-xylanase [Cytophagaceae bacterium]|nr:endo-1,4-beta-xylanase [Cytophagaceae bacterium]
MKGSIFIFALLFFYSFSFSQNEKKEKVKADDLPIPAGGEKVVGTESYFLKLQSSGEADVKRVSPEGTSYTSIQHIRTLETSSNPWELQIATPTLLPIEKEDVLLLTFFARSVTAEKAYINCIFEKGSPDWDKSLTSEVTINTGWDKFALPFVSQNSFQPGEAKLSFQIGGNIQTIEIADVQLINYKKTKTLESLPSRLVSSKEDKTIAGVSKANLNTDIPAGGEDMLGSLSSFQKLQSTGNADLKMVNVQGEAFTRALQINVTEAAGNPWELQVSSGITGKTETGDILLLTFYARSISAEKGDVVCLFEKGSPEWDKSLEETVKIGHMWERYHIPFDAKNTFNAGEAKINFRVGSKEQVLQFAEVRLVNYKKKVSLTALPQKTRFEKEGAPKPSEIVEATPVANFERGELNPFESTDKNIPTGGGEVIASIATFQFQNNGKAEFQKVAVTGQTFKEALQVTTLEIPGNPWDIQLSAKNEGGVRKGDVLLLTFMAKSVKSKDETGQVFGVAIFEKAGPDWAKSLIRDFSVGVDWQRFYIPFVAEKNFAKGEAQLNFQVGIKEQTIQIADAALINFTDAKTIKDLPVTKYSYAGREPDAVWRKQAEANIEKYRKGDIKFLVTDKSGKVVPDVTVKISMKKHAYGFGTAVDANELLRNEKYQAVIRENFNKAVLENDLKWPQWLDPFNKQQTFKALDWFSGNKIPVRGHTLVWPSWQWLPEFLKDYQKDTAKLRKTVLDHMKEELEATKGRLVEWDVLNEPFTNTDLQKLLGDKAMVEWFKTADAMTHDSVKLYINDFGILSDGGNNKLHQDHYYNTIKYITSNGAKINGIGFQGHFGWQLTSPQKVWSLLDRYGELASELQVTEFDIDITDEELQAEYTRDFMTTFFSHPKTSGFMIWGFWEGRHWRPNGAMYRKNWTAKPNLKVWQDLIYNKWWTKEEKKPDATGAFKIRGFLGEYQYEVVDKTGKIIKSGTFSLPHKGIDMKIIL